MGHPLPDERGGGLASDAPSSRLPSGGLANLAAVKQEAPLIALKKLRLTALPPVAP